MPIKYHPSHLN
jgi:hypothetical protein